MKSGKVCVTIENGQVVKVKTLEEPEIQKIDVMSSGCIDMEEIVERFRKNAEN